MTQHSAAHPAVRMWGPPTTRVLHRRPVVWSDVVDREVVEPVAHLQNPRTLFPVGAGVRLPFT